MFVYIESKLNTLKSHILMMLWDFFFSSHMLCDSASGISIQT